MFVFTMTATDPRPDPLVFIPHPHTLLILRLIFILNYNIEVLRKVFTLEVCHLKFCFALLIMSLSTVRFPQGLNHVTNIVISSSVMKGCPYIIMPGDSPVQILSGITISVQE